MKKQNPTQGDGFVKITASFEKLEASSGFQAK